MKPDSVTYTLIVSTFVVLALVAIALIGKMLLIGVGAVIVYALAWTGYVVVSYVRHTL